MISNCISQPAEIPKQNESTRFTPTRTTVLAVFVIPLFGIVFAVVISSLSNMSADPQHSGENEVTATDTELDGVHEPHPESMEVQTDDRTDTDIVSSDDTQAEAPVPMDVDPADTSEREEDGERKAQEIEASPTTNIGTVGDKENAGDKADEQLKNYDKLNTGHVSGKGDIGIDTGELRKTGDESDMVGVSQKDVSVQRQAHQQKEPGQGKNTGVSDQGSVQQNAGEPRTRNDKGTESRESENKDKHGDGDRDNIQLSTQEPGKTCDTDRDDVSHEDVSQEDKDTEDVTVTVSDKSSIEQNAGKPSTSTEVSVLGDKENAQENTDAVTESDNKNSDIAGVKAVQQNTDKSGESENKDEDGAGDHDNMQLSPHEPPKTGDIEMDDVSDKDNAQQNAEGSVETVDNDIDDDGDKEREVANGNIFCL
ncbi:hypothetical protein NP493_1054g00052 [Ridgeia piscesae]|uniref:Uncharacterized protein n=1 Tax=Ridgeia piscesae TaxID=27915 RepID=A0AAD9KHZ6_RIDPI|nr:hypothetical protein NP493_1054g00052 [Ridgeia piscesae]